MKKVKFFIQPKVQSDADFQRLEDRINEYINSLPGITLGPRPHGFLDIEFNISSSSAEYSDIVAIVVSEDDNETSKK